MLASPKGAEAAIERRDVAVLLRLAGVDAVPLDLVVVRPFQDGLAGEPGAIVRDNNQRKSRPPSLPVGN